MAKRKIRRKKSKDKARAKKVDVEIVKKLQLFFEIIVVIGFAISLVPFGYLFSMMWVIPFSALNFIISLVWTKKTVGWDIVTFAMAVISVVPVLGFFFRIVGLLTSALAAREISS